MNHMDPLPDDPNREVYLFAADGLMLLFTIVDLVSWGSSFYLGPVSRDQLVLSLPEVICSPVAPQDDAAWNAIYRRFGFSSEGRMWRGAKHSTCFSVPIVGTQSRKHLFEVRLVSQLSTCRTVRRSWTRRMPCGRPSRCRICRELLRYPQSHEVPQTEPSQCRSRCCGLRFGPTIRRR
jgi:hypothetical protein